MLSHRNILSNVQTVIPLFNINENDVLLSFLPLCHMFERTCGYYTMLIAFFLFQISVEREMLNS